MRNIIVHVGIALIGAITGIVAFIVVQHQCNTRKAKKQHEKDLQDYIRGGDLLILEDLHVERHPYPSDCEDE